MGFPQLAEIATSGESANTTVHTVKVPLTTVPGDMLILLTKLDGSATLYEPLAGWTRIASSFSTGAKVFYRVADGTEADFTYQSIKSDSVLRLRREQSMNICLRVTGWDGLTAPYIRLSGGGRRITANPNVHVSWGADNNTFIAFYFQAQGTARLGVGLTQRYPRLSTNRQTGDNGGPGPGGVSWGIASREYSATNQAWPGGEEIFTTDRTAGVLAGQVVVRGT